MLTSAVVTFRTRDDDKDSDTALWITVVKNGYTIASTGPIFGHFDDWSSDGPYHLNIMSPLNRADIAGSNLNISIQPNGNDTWKFDLHIDLYFNDGGPVYSRDFNGNGLDQDSRNGSYQLT